LPAPNGASKPNTLALTRKQQEGKTRREALRALKRHLARHVFNLLRRPASAADIPAVVKVRGGKVRPPTTGHLRAVEREP
jgi:hypothetical protein